MEKMKCIECIESDSDDKLIVEIYLHRGSR